MNPSKICKFPDCHVSFDICSQCKIGPCYHEYHSSRCKEAHVFEHACQCTAHRTGRNNEKWCMCENHVKEGFTLCRECETACQQIVSTNMLNACQVFLGIAVAYINTFRSASAAFVTYVGDYPHILIIGEIRNEILEWGFPGGKRRKRIARHKSEMPPNTVLRQCWIEIPNFSIQHGTVQSSGMVVVKPRSKSKYARGTDLIYVFLIDRNRARELLTKNSNRYRTKQVKFVSFESINAGHPRLRRCSQDGLIEIQEVAAKLHAGETNVIIEAEKYREPTKDITAFMNR